MIQDQKEQLRFFPGLRHLLHEEHQKEQLEEWQMMTLLCLNQWESEPVSRTVEQERLVQTWILEGLWLREEEE